MRNKILITCAVFSATVLSGESLWHSKKNSEASMFADRIASNVGDILLVVIDESTIVTRTASKNTSSSSSQRSNITSFLYPNTTTGFGKHNGSLPSINISPSSSMTGEGSFSDTNIVEARIAVMVVDVKPNGNLVVEGARKIESNGERQYVVMRGEVRSDDVMPNNSVLSTSILNANVELLGDGDIAKAQEKGRLSQLIDTLNIL